jgi:hypothetical protein
MWLSHGPAHSFNFGTITRFVPSADMKFGLSSWRDSTISMYSSPVMVLREVRFYRARPTTPFDLHLALSVRLFPPDRTLGSPLPPLRGVGVPSVGTTAKMWVLTFRQCYHRSCLEEKANPR